MSRSPTTAIHYPAPTLGLAARLAILGVVFFADKLLLNGFVDFQRAQAARGLGEIVRIGQHWGFRFLVALASAVLILAYVRSREALKPVDAAVRATGIRIRWVLAHALCIACLIPVNYFLYREEVAPLPFGVVVALLLAFGLGAALSAALAMAHGSLWLKAARALGVIWCYAAIAAFVAASAMQMSQRLWESMAALTFDLVRRVLLPIVPTLNADSATHVLSTNRFAVEVSETCSGLEGMGLMLAFTVAWLFYFRREYIFPRALLLIPIGLAAIFALNVLRIAALLLIGHAGFPGVAQYGFHSQAGWIAFNVVACGLVFISRRSAWLNRDAHESPRLMATDNPTATYLVPLLAILAAGVLSHAMSSRFEILYPLRLAVGLGALALYRRKLLRALDWSWSWRGPVVGLLVFVLWMVAAKFLIPASAMPGPLAELSPSIRIIWIVCRTVASVLTVPIAEELAYRGYLMRRLSSDDFESVQFQQVRWPALLVTAVVFGLAHGNLWLPGVAAGLAFGLLLRRTRSMGETVVAHATTNALIGASVLGFGQWQLW